MSDNRFIDLFKRHHWVVEELAENSFIAYNDMYFVAFSCVSLGSILDKYISGVSYLLVDKDSFIESWRKYNEGLRIPEGIGFYAFSQYMNRRNNKFIHFGGIANHDHDDYYEIESWLDRIDFCKNQ